MHEINHTSPNIADIPLQLPQTSRAQRALLAADRIGDFQASILVRIVASAFGFTTCEMFHHTRSRAPVAGTRQLAMYMMHVVLGRNLTDVGRFFGRDRTTVAYACSRIEDMRDDVKFDEKITNLEQAFNDRVIAQSSTKFFLPGASDNDL